MLFILFLLSFLSFIRRTRKAEKTINQLSAFLVCHENDVLDYVKIRTKSLRLYVEKLRKIDRTLNEEIEKINREVDEEKARHRPRKTILKKLSEKLETIEEIIIWVNE
jgi:hypothetical protein